MNIKRIGAILLTVVVLMFSSISVEAHPGRLDKKGGHNVRTDGWGYKVGSYHYHSGSDRDIAYDKDGNVIAKTTSKSSTSSSETKSTTSSSKTTTSSTTKTEIKKHQTQLNELGYDCGTPDGIIGKKTTSAIKAFQKDKDLTVNGKFDDATVKALYE